MAIFIYGLVCPVDQVIRYVGKSIEPAKRLQGHIAGAKNGSYNHHTARWIRSLLERDLLPILQILVELRDGTRWQDIEREFIANASAKGWKLTNSTAGGEGLDYIDPEDTARYRSNLSRSLKAIWSTPERREEARLRAVAVHADPEIAARRVASMKEAAKRPETKAKMSAASKEINARPEVKASRSESAKRMWQQPGHSEKVFDAATRKKMSDSAKQRWVENRPVLEEQYSDPGRSAKLSAAMTRRNADPEFAAKARGPEARAKQGLAMKANWAMRKAAKAAAQQDRS